MAEAEAVLLLHGWVATHHNGYDQRYCRRRMHELPPLKHDGRMTLVDVHHVSMIVAHLRATGVLEPTD